MEGVGPAWVVIGLAIHRDHFVSPIEQRFQDRLAKRLLAVQNDSHSLDLSGNAAVDVNYFAGNETRFRAC